MMDFNPELREPAYASEEHYRRIFAPILRRLEFPQIQVALDVPRAPLEHIVRVAEEAYRGGARIIEAGTPPIKDHGVRSLIPALRDAAPDALILADLKTYDMGKLEAEIAIDYGADIVSVLGRSGREVVSEALSEAKRRDKAVCVDLMGCSDQEAEALMAAFLRDAEEMMFSKHLGVTQQMQQRGVYGQREQIESFVRKAERYVKAVAGGMKEGTIKHVAALGVDVVVVGSAIYNSDRPRAAVERMLREAKEHYQPHRR